MPWASRDSASFDETQKSSSSKGASTTVTKGESSSADSQRDPFRGRQAIFDKIHNVKFGTVQEPSSCTTQLEECEAFCRSAVMSALPGFRDFDFPPDERSLFINGEYSRSGTLHGVQWRRAGEIIDAKNGINGINYQGSRFIPGPFNEIYLLGVLGALRRIEDPSNLLFVDMVKGAYGCRLYKDGEWIYEILDDFLPCDATGQLLFGRTSDPHAVWGALILKAYAKVHGTYEYVATIGTEVEALEDMSGFGVTHWPLSDRPVWGELWQYMRKRHGRGYISLAVSSGSTPGSLLPAHAYPISAFANRKGEMLILLQNVWQSGGHNGTHATMESSSYQVNFWISITEFVKYFTHIVEARFVSPYWQMAATCFSTERCSYPLISVSSPGQGLIVVTQMDRRYGEQAQSIPIGFRVYRCRKTGLAAEGGASPFQNMELVFRRPAVIAHCVMAELKNVEADCLYVVHVETEGTSPRLKLRWYSSSAMNFRELSRPEANYFLNVQQFLTSERHSFSSKDSYDDIIDVETSDNSTECGCVFVKSFFAPLEYFFRIR